MRKLLFIALLFCLPAFGQVTVSPFITPNVQFLNNSGTPLANGKVCTFAAGSTTPQTSYSDSAGSVANQNPVILDSAGRASIWLTTQTYKIVIAASTANSQCSPAITSTDNVSWATMANTVTSLVDTGALTVQASAAATSGANQSSPLLCVQGNYWTGAASASDKWCLQDLLGTGSNPTTTLNVTHGAGSSGTAGMNLASALTVTGAATLSSVNNVQYAALTTGDCGIGAAYAALPATGGRVQLVSDCTVSAAQTITTTVGKTLNLDLAGRTITCTVGNNVTCLTLLQTAGGTRYQITLENGTIAYSGAGTGVIGLQIGDFTQCVTGCVNSNKYSKLIFNNFSTSGSTALSLSNVQDSHFDSIQFNNNTIALALNKFTNQNQFSNIWFQADVTAILSTDATEFTFEDCLVQSNTGVKPVQIIASALSVFNVRFKHCHFENSGDTTVNTRQIAFSAAAGKIITAVTIENTVFNSGANTNAGSFVYDFSGAGSLTYLHLNSNHYFTNTNFFNGFTGDIGITAVNDNAGANADVSIDSENVTGCINGGTGVTFSPIGASHIYQIHGGSPNFENGFLEIKDCTAGLVIADYHGSTWHFATQIQMTGTGTSNNLIFNESSAPSGGASQDWVWGDSTAHRLKMNNNNGGATNVVGASDITATLKTGTGAGNYTSASTTYVRIDSTNLAYTVTIPTGWKLIINASGNVTQATASAGVNVALADGSSDNTGILVEIGTFPATSGGGSQLCWALNYIVNGDGASHTINLQYKTANASDSVSMINANSTSKPVMTFLLTPSN